MKDSPLLVHEHLEAARDDRPEHHGKRWPRPLNQCASDKSISAICGRRRRSAIHLPRRVTHLQARRESRLPIWEILMQTPPIRRGAQGAFATTGQ